MRTYSRLFDIPKNKKLKHTSYKWTDEVFSDFMISILKNLEPRFVNEHEMIIEELQ